MLPACVFSPCRWIREERIRQECRNQSEMTSGVISRLPRASGQGRMRESSELLLAVAPRLERCLRSVPTGVAQFRDNDLERVFEVAGRIQEVS